MLDPHWVYLGATLGLLTITSPHPRAWAFAVYQRAVCAVIVAAARRRVRLGTAQESA